MKKNFLPLLCPVCLAMIILLGNLFLVYPNAHAQGKPQTSNHITYTFHLLSHLIGKGKVHGVSAKVVAKTPKPNVDSPCLGVAMAINPRVNAVQVIMGISNQCGITVVTVQWDYTSTAICNGQAYNGPQSSGSVARINAGVYVTVANDTWDSVCLDNGVPVPHTLSFTGTADGYFAPPYKGSASGREDYPPVTIP